MRVLHSLVVVFLAILGLAAGFAKLIAAPHEVAFFARFGLGEIAVMFAGGLQVLGAVAIAIPRLRLPGAVLTAISFGVSSLMIFASGQVLFGTVSLLPVVLSIYVAWSAKVQDTA